MADMLKTVELLRFKYQYKGYIHLKILPGATYDYVEKATELATRVSINVEAPNQKRLKSLSKTKNLSDDVLVRMKWVNKLMGRNRLPAGQTTQFVVGAAGESDAEILGSVNNLYRNYGLRRAYFSAFQPIPETPLEDVAATPLLREHRLYQADILMRQYRLTFEELSFDKNGNLPLEMDPKLAVALKNIDRYPLEVNKASYYELLRVPGIGHTSAGRIIKARKSCRITEITQLKRMGVVVTRALPFLTVNGKIYNSFKHVEQLALWSDEGVDLSQVNSPLLFEGSLASAVK